MLKMKQLFLILISTFAIANVHAQASTLSDITDLNQNLLKKQLAIGDDSEINESNSDSYDSFSKNSFDNTVNQIKTLQPMTEEKFLESELRKKRVLLAAELCDLDPRACILIEN